MSGIPFFACLDIHSHIVDEPFLAECAQDIRSASVGVQFDLISQFTHLQDKGTKIRLERRFAAGDGNTFQDPAAFGQKLQNFLFGKSSFCILSQQISVMAEWASEIAAQMAIMPGNCIG